MPAAPLVDETAPAELEALMADDTRHEPPVMVCDPYWDFTDVPDLEVYEVDVGAEALGGAPVE